MLRKKCVTGWFKRWKREKNKETSLAQREEISSINKEISLLLQPTKVWKNRSFLSSSPTAILYTLVWFYFIYLFYQISYAFFHLTLLIDVREGCHYFFMADIIKSICRFLPVLPLPLTLFFSSLYSFVTHPLLFFPSREVAVLPHCHSHHHQSANCWPWEGTSLCLVIPFLHPAFSHSLPHTQSSTSLTFTLHFPYHLSSSLFLSSRAVSLSPHPTILTTHRLLLSVSCTVNWFSLCVL